MTMASLGNDNIRRAIQNTVGIANAIRQAQAGQPTTFNLPIPQVNDEQMQANAEQFNPASRVPDVVDKVGELDLRGRVYDPDLDHWNHAYGTRPGLPGSSVYQNENERRKGGVWQDFINNSIYNIANGPGQIKKTGTVPRSYLSVEGQKRLWPNYSDIPLDARLTPEQWLSGGKSDVYRYLGGGA